MDASDCRAQDDREIVAFAEDAALLREEPRFQALAA